MESLLLSIDVTLPLFIMMALGYLLKCLKLVDSEVLAKINKLNFNLFLPLMMFNNLYSTNISEVWNGTAVLITVGSAVVIFLTLIFIVPVFVKDNSRKSVVIQGIFRANYSYVGIPVAMTLCGSMNAGLSAILLAIISPLYNAASVLCFELFRGGKPRLGQIFKKIITNPLIIASILGVIGMLIHLEFPSVIKKTLTDLSGVCTPLALISLGGFFSFGSLKGNTKILTVSSIIKLIVIPAIFFPIAIAFGMRGDSLAALFAFYATPTAVASFTLAQMLGGDVELAGQMVVVQSCASIATMFAWVFVLNSFGLF